MLLAVIAAFFFAAVRPEPVAAGFPAWTGVSEQDWLSGRQISSAYLRHKAVMVVEFDAAQAEEQLKAAAFLAGLLPQYRSDDALAGKPYPRSTCAVLSCRGENISAKKVAAAVKAVGATERCFGEVPIYRNLTFPGAPNAAGKTLPFVYVLGPEGTNCLFAAKLDEAAVKKAKEQLKAAAPAADAWRPFYGTVKEPHYVTQLTPALEKGKPLDSVAKTARRGVTDKDAEKARECQIIADAIEQARVDQAAVILAEAEKLPHHAAYDLANYLKSFPNERKQFAAFTDLLKARPELAKAAKLFSRVMELKEPDVKFRNRREAERALKELETIKAVLEKQAQQKDLDRYLTSIMALASGEVDEAIANVREHMPEK